jgi:3-oxoacyl-[acyl-carrier protein] reductase
MDLEGKVAIVTGASRGIGKGIALAYGAQGAHVVVASRTASSGDSALPGSNDETMAAINALGLGRSMTMTCDVTKEEDLQNLVAQTVAEFGRIDIFVNNAGGSFRPAPLADLTVTRWDRVMDLNLRAVMLSCKTLIPVMVAQKSGNILNLSSGAAISSSPAMIAYNVAKAAQDRLTICLAEELKDHGIAVNGYRPGLVRTEGMDSVDPDGKMFSDAVDRPPVVGPSTVWLAQQTAETFTGQIVDRGEFGNTWGPGSA